MEVIKQLRQREIRELLAQRPIRTQQELAAALRERGFRATQATISRDVAELGLIKSTQEGVQTYVVPTRVAEAESTGEERLRALLDSQGNLLHPRCPGVSCQDLTHECECDSERQDGDHTDHCYEALLAPGQ